MPDVGSLGPLPCSLPLSGSKPAALGGHRAPGPGGGKCTSCASAAGCGPCMGAVASVSHSEERMDDTEMHSACLTSDGVLLRLVIDGQVVAEARSVLYAPQPPELFVVPPGYEPALAPGGGPAE